MPPKIIRGPADVTVGTVLLELKNSNNYKVIDIFGDPEGPPAGLRFMLEKINNGGCGYRYEKSVPYGILINEFLVKENGQQTT